MDVAARVRRTIRRHRLADAGTAVVAAVSGGSDSVALAYVLRNLAEARELRVSGLAHFNHQLRATADRDEAFCAGLAASLGWPFLSEREDVAAFAARERRSLEDAARTARYAFLERARRHFGADAVAVGHTRDDQAETFLLRLIRGAGARGLAGIHPRRGTIIRPLLDCRRAELQRALEEWGVTYVVDETNADVAIPRNRIRTELVPLLASRFNPSIVNVLADAAAVARDEWDWMDREAAALTSRICHVEDDGSCRIEASALAEAPPALARLVLRRSLPVGARAAPLSYEHLECALAVARGERAAVDLPHARVERVGCAVVLRGRDGAGRSGGTAQPNLFRYPLSIPGEVWLSELNCVVSAEPAGPGFAARAVPGTSRTQPAEPGLFAAVRLDRCGPRLAVRNRRQGDRFRPPGLDGTKKLQDFFVDKKVGRRERDAVPLVVDDSDRIVWVAGHVVPEEFRVTDPAQAVLILRLKELGRP